MRIFKISNELTENIIENFGTVLKEIILFFAENIVLRGRIITNYEINQIL
jgi:hypothetical protein